MSTRNKARKSTTPRKSQDVNGNASGHHMSRRSVGARNSSRRDSSGDSAESEAPTQCLRRQSSASLFSTQSTPGPSGLSSQANNSTRQESDSDTSPRNRNARRRVRWPMESSPGSPSDTTSDSDAPVQERSTVQKKKKTAKRGRPQPGTPTRSKKPAAKKAQRKKNSDSDEYTEFTSPSKSQTQNSRSVSSLANKCVYYLLICDQKKYAIKRPDIIKQVFGNQNHKLFNAVIEEANNVLKKVYGIEIIVNEKRRGEYLLINYLDRDLSVQEFSELSNLDLQKRGLIFYLLTVIYMNGNSITEDELCVALKSLGVDMTSRTPHTLFGDVHKYLTGELVKQMYLEHTCISKDPPQFEFSWGVRAKQEVDKKDLLDFACKIMSDTNPEDWILQHKDALEAAKEKDKSTRK